MEVIKRNGEKSKLDAEKINKVLIWATENISGVSASDVAMNAHIQFYQGIKTTEIHNVLIQSAVDLISEKNPNYQYVAANLLNYLLRKEALEVNGENLPPLFDIVNRNVNLGFYDQIILDKYTESEFGELNLYIRHNRDYEFTYAGIQQLIDKYLVKDRTTGKSYETPQYAFMLIAMTVFMDHEPSEKLFHINEFESSNLGTYFFVSMIGILLFGLYSSTYNVGDGFSSCNIILKLEGKSKNTASSL